MKKNEDKEKEELWKKFKNLEIEKIVNFSRGDIMRDLYHRVTSIDEKKIIEKELHLTHFIQYVSHNLTCFEPDLKSINDLILQFRLHVGNKIGFYEKRLEESKTPLLIAHYSFACFILGQGSKITTVLESTLQYSILQLKSSYKYNFLNCSYLLTISFNLNNLYGLKQEEKINQFTLEIIDTLKQDPKHLIGPLEIIAKLSLISPEKLDELIQFGLSNFTLIKFVDVQEKFLVKIIGLCDLNKDKYKQIKIGIYSKIAESYEQEALDKKSFIAIMNLEKANKYYIKLNDKEKIQHINEKIRHFTKTMNYTVIETQIEVPKILIKGETRTEKVTFIANFPYMVPDLGELKQNIQNNTKSSPIQELFDVKYFEKDKPSNESSEINQKLMRETIFHIQHMEMGLSVTVEKLEKIKQILPEDYMDFIKSFGLHHDASLEIIKRGIERHFAGDFISSIHNMIPQIEFTLREILDEKGIKLIKPKKEISFILLSKIIDQCKNIFDENVIHYLKVKFGDDEGLNQRNNISHAFLSDISKFNHESSLALIYIVMRLLVLKNQKI